MPLFNSKSFNWPKDGDLNAWADFAETICMFSEDNFLSVDAFVDFLTDVGDRTTAQILKAVNFNENFLENAIAMAAPAPPAFLANAEMAEQVEEGEDQDQENDADDEFDGDDAANEEKEVLQSRVLSLFHFLNARQQYFGAKYPFTVQNSIHLQQVENHTEVQQMYILLLVFSQMHLYTPGDINRLGHRFEALCRLPFTYLLPQSAEKRFFGAGGGQIIAADYQGNLRQRLIGLANDLHIKYNEDIDDPDELGPGGDGGLDWVGWVPFEDNCDHQPIYFGQCACGANWVDKQHETSLSIWRNYFHITQALQCFHFMPRSFRRTSLDWFRKTQIHHELTLIDRFRLLEIFERIDQDPFAEILDGFTDILDEAAAFEIDQEQ